MADRFQPLLARMHALMRAAMGNMFRVGTIYEAKGDKVRVMFGYDKNKQPVLSPWLHTGNHRGGAREQRFYKGDKENKGQTVMLLAPDGDMRKAVVMPYAPNKDFLRPDHAPKSGQDEETYQLEDLRVRKKKDTYTIWFQPPRQQNQQQQGGQGATQMPDEDSDADPEKAVMVLKMNKDKGIVARYGKKMRMVVTKDMVKMKANNDFAIVKDGSLIVSKEWQVGSDDSQDDDSL